MRQKHKYKLEINFQCWTIQDINLFARYILKIEFVNNIVSQDLYFGSDFLSCTDIRDCRKSRDRRFYSRLTRRRRSGRIPLPNDVAESPLFPREGKEVTRKVALWYTAKPTNDMRQETMVVRRITGYANLPKTVCRQVPSRKLARFYYFGKIH